MKIHRMAIGFAALSLAACASKPPAAYVAMSYSSSPSGARIIRDGVTVGRTPMTLLVKTPLQVSEADGSVTSECLTPDPVTFKWASGAKATVTNPCQSSGVNTTRFERAPGSKRQYTAAISMSAARPADAPGLTKDIRTANGLAILASIPVPTPYGYDGVWRRSGLVSGYGLTSIGIVSGYFNTTIPLQ